VRPPPLTTHSGPLTVTAATGRPEWLRAARRISRYSVSMPEIPGTLTAALHREEDWYVAGCLEVDVASQGHTIDEALANLAEAVELYLEEVDDPAGHLTATPLVTTFRLPAA
jgi:predicted RNase H-like HicB family nuclease